MSFVEPNSGRLPIHVALETGNKKLIQAFVANGASLIARDWEGNTAYHYAATTSQEIIQVKYQQFLPINLINNLNVFFSTSNLF
jgi:ankyrin repeat protein